MDLISGVASLNGYDGEYQFAGETEVDWSNQKTVTNEQGQSKVTCDNGHEWWATIKDAEADERVNAIGEDQVVGDMGEDGNFGSDDADDEQEDQR